MIAKIRYNCTTVYSTHKTVVLQFSFFIRCSFIRTTKMIVVFSRRFQIHTVLVRTLILPEYFEYSTAAGRDSMSCDRRCCFPFIRKRIVKVVKVMIASIIVLLFQTWSTRVFNYMSQQCLYCRQNMNLCPASSTSVEMTNCPGSSCSPPKLRGQSPPSISLPIAVRAFNFSLHQFLFWYNNFMLGWMLCASRGFISVCQTHHTS